MQEKGDNCPVFTQLTVGKTLALNFHPFLAIEERVLGSSWFPLLLGQYSLLPKPSAGVACFRKKSKAYS